MNTNIMGVLAGGLVGIAALVLPAANSSARADSSVRAGASAHAVVAEQQAPCSITTASDSLTAPVNGR